MAICRCRSSRILVQILGAYDMTLAINVLGWIGVAALLLAYWLVSTQKTAGDSRGISMDESRWRCAGPGELALLRRVPIGWCECRLDRDRHLRAGQARLPRNDTG